MQRGTSLLPKANMSATMNPMFDPERRAESTSSGAFANAAITRGATMVPIWSGTQRPRMRCGRRPPAVVETSATPLTRSANSSGCRSARAMIDMPPIECPTSTTSPFGATSSITLARSSPSCSMVACSRSDRSERPCERWS